MSVVMNGRLTIPPDTFAFILRKKADQEHFPFLANFLFHNLFLTASQTSDTKRIGNKLT
jgi:hypothetical protein